MALWLTPKWWDEKAIHLLENEVKTLRKRYIKLRNSVNIEEEINGHTARYGALAKEKDRAMTNLHLAEKRLKDELQERSMHTA